MEKYIIISHSYGKAVRGAFKTAERFKNLYPDTLEHFEDIEIKNIEVLKSINKRIIFFTQVPHKYSFKLTFPDLVTMNHVIFIRNNHNYNPYNSASNGFSYYKTYNRLKNFIPIITDFYIDSKERKRPCLGFYYRPQYVSDSMFLINNFLNDIRDEIDIYTMGHSFSHKQKNIVNNNHTYDNKIFFQNITHFVHPASSTFIDPFPNTLLEAVQCDKQIIIIESPDRIHFDGLDDIRSCINYRTKLDLSINISNSHNFLVSSNFNSFYNYLFDNKFEYTLDRDKYNTFYDWVHLEIL